jgi:hypothetical protein
MIASAEASQLHSQALCFQVVPPSSQVDNRSHSMNGTMANLIRGFVLPLAIPLGIRAGRKLFQFRVDEVPLVRQ